jgi:phosphate starvation-inducible protein PhoH
LKTDIVELRLAPEDNRRLANLCGPLDENLRQIEAADREMLAAALNTTLSDQEWDILWVYAQQLPDAADGATDAGGGEVEGES